MAATPRPLMCTIDTDHPDSTTDVYQLHDAWGGRIGGPEAHA
jgi:hypothetical protein